MNPTPDLIPTALKTLSALGIVLGGLLVVYYFARRFTRANTNRAGQKMIRVLASQYIGVKKNICLVEAAGTVLVLGVTNDNISLLAQIEDPAVLEKLHDRPADNFPLSFADHLNKITLKFKAGKNQK